MYEWNKYKIMEGTVYLVIVPIIYQKKNTNSTYNQKLTYGYDSSKKKTYCYLI